MNKQVPFAVSLTLAASMSAHPVTAEPANSISYGPEKNDVDLFHGKNVKNVSEYFGKFGAPYAQYNVGDKLVYRWGHGVTKMLGANANIVRDELLVTTNKSGDVLDVTYRRKFDGIVAAAVASGDSP